MAATGGVVSLQDWAERKVVEIAAARARARLQEVRVGKLGTAWEALSGWKSWIVAVVAVWKLMCQDCATSSGYADAILKGIGWSDTAAAFDPAQAAMALGVAVALGHKLVKAVQEFRAGVPAKLLQSSIVAQGKG